MPDLPAAPESVLSPKVHAHISHAVIATYAADAAQEVAGVHALLGGHFGSLDRRTDPERAAKAVRVSPREDGVSLAIHLVVEWDVSIPDVAAAVSDQVCRYLREMVDLDAEVTVYVDGVAPAAAR